MKRLGADPNPPDAETMGAVVPAAATDAPAARRWAHVTADGTVDNVSLWDGVEYDPETGLGWTPPDEANMHELPDDSTVGPGWTWDGKQFTAPPEPQPDPFSAAMDRARTATTASGKVNAVIDALAALNPPGA